MCPLARLYPHSGTGTLGRDCKVQRSSIQKAWLYERNISVRQLAPTRTRKLEILLRTGVMFVWFAMGALIAMAILLTWLLVREKRRSHSSASALAATVEQARAQ